MHSTRITRDGPTDHWTDVLYIIVNNNFSFFHWSDLTLTTRSTAPTLINWTFTSVPTKIYPT